MIRKNDNNDIFVETPLKVEDTKQLKAGDYVYITGKIYSARDAAHKRMFESIVEGKEIPIDLENNIIYYLGPTPAREGKIIGSAGTYYIIKNG